MRSLTVRIAVGLLVVDLCLCTALCAAAASGHSGNWIMKHSDVAGKVDFTISESASTVNRSTNPIGH